jgi:hypothetical protein
MEDEKSWQTDKKFLGVAIINMDNENPDATDVVEKILALGCYPGDIMEATFAKVHAESL